MRTVAVRVWVLVIAAVLTVWATDSRADYGTPTYYGYPFPVLRASTAEGVCSALSGLYINPAFPREQGPYTFNPDTCAWGSCWEGVGLCWTADGSDFYQVLDCSVSTDCGDNMTAPAWSPMTWAAPGASGGGTVDLSGVTAAAAAAASAASSASAGVSVGVSVALYAALFFAAMLGYRQGRVG